MIANCAIWLAGVTHLPLLLAPFGASAVLLSAQAASPLARLTHPPAGAMPVVVAGSTTMPALELLAIAVAGAAVMTLYAALHHRLPPRFDYPKAPAPTVS